MKQKKVSEITARDVDFAQWYTDVCRKAELMDYSDAKGFIIYRPYGYAMWEEIQHYFNKKIKASGHQNVYMPLLIPHSLLEKEKEHVDGFAPECAYVTKGGSEILDEPLIIRPTSEVLFCQHFAKIVNSYRDLPKLYNQWCSVVRWEKTTRPFLRGKEFLWQEGHTIHETEEEAKAETLMILDYYRKLGEELLAIPFIIGQKTEKEKFAGAVATYSIEALMHDGVALQSGTSHYFGSGFAEAFNIRFQGRDGKLQTVQQTSWGISTRLLGAIIMVHGDDEGLVMPPYVAPTQVVIIPIQSQKEGVLEQASLILTTCQNLGIRAQLDDSDRSPGWKFAEYEMKGIPLRIEIGPRDAAANQCVVVLRHSHEKLVISLDDLKVQIPTLLQKMHAEMYQRALHHVNESTRVAVDYAQMQQIITQQNGYVKLMWCGEEACENKIKEDTTATIRCIPFEQEALHENCCICGKKAKVMVYVAKAY